MRLLLCALLIGLTGCGFKGPLYLPDAKAAAAAAAKTSPASPQASTARPVPADATPAPK
jgi:predicted small lipoprotein YifL